MLIPDDLTKLGDLQIPVSTILIIVGGFFGFGWLVKKIYDMTLGVVFGAVRATFKGVLSSLVRPNQLAAFTSYLVSTLLFIGGCGLAGYGASTSRPEKPKNPRQEFLEKVLSKSADTQFVSEVINRTDQYESSEEYRRALEAYYNYQAPPIPVGTTVLVGLAMVICGFVLAMRTSCF